MHNPHIYAHFSWLPTIYAYTRSRLYQARRYETKGGMDRSNVEYRSDSFEETRIDLIGPPVSADRGRRAIVVVHATGEKSELVDGCCRIFVSDKKKSTDSDYHGDMDSSNFEKWLE